MKNFKYIKKCQVSGSKKLKKILSLGSIPFVNDTHKINSNNLMTISAPLELYYCPTSKLVQLNIEVDKKILFPKSYPYTSSTTKILRENFSRLRNQIDKNNFLKKNDLIIDIGSNDGNLLSNFKDRYKVLGVTPENIGKIAIKKGIPTIIDYFDTPVVTKINKKYGKAKIITATNVFAHINEVNKLIKNIKRCLVEDGVFISESHYLLPLIETNQYDTIYHEHLRYYSLTSLNYLFSMHQLEIFKAEKIDTHGGSIRIYAARKKIYKIDASVKRIKNNEKNLEKKLLNFQDRVLNSKLEFYNLLTRIRKNKKNLKIAGISAPSRSTTLINYLGLDENIIECIFEVKGSKKIGMYLPGTKIKIIEEKIQNLKEYQYLLIFSWHIQKDIIKVLRKKGYKGKFIIPLPEPRVI
ncbi:class I SAM-dependent methyltransferase [Candidatus Pelagibacter sp.]|nr:class I SAM-dependent methyltransferase [Candidatus Pelagibacter sp.]